MTITGIDIKEYQQFKDLKFDFTYPKGHPKEGQPMDKVCFIGQSGTGKTTLLEMLASFLYIGDGENGTEQLKNFFKNSVNISKIGSNEEAVNKQMIYVTDNTLNKSEAFLETFFGIPWSRFKIEDILNSDKISSNLNKFIILNEDLSLQEVWREILMSIVSYSLEFQHEVNNILKKPNLVEKIGKWIIDWKKYNPDPKIELTDKCLNPILKHFFLEIDVDDVVNPLSIKQLNKDLHIDYNKLSSGTKQILSTAIPIFKLDTKGTVILFDEPERSLFPDLQREIIDYYTGLAPEAQFFFATHSPIIAAAFEPCERFILYFDEEGNVKYRNGVAPIGDDPNDILSEDFEMMPLTNKKGVEAYQKWLDLASQIRSEKDEQKKKELLHQRIDLGNRYNFL